MLIRPLTRGVLALACAASPWSVMAQQAACSPGPCTAKDTLVSNTAQARLQLAVDAADTRRVMIGAGDTAGCASTLAVWLSLDRGRQWRHSCVGGWWDFPWSEPAVAFDADGRALVVTSKAWELDGQTVEAMLQVSTDHGQTWTEPRSIAENSGLGELSDLQLKSDLGAHSRRRGNLYLVYQDGQSGPDHVGTIRVARSTDHAATWRVSRVSPEYLIDYDGDGFRHLNFPRSPDLAIGRRGDLYLTYARCETLRGCHETETQVFFVRSTDGGRTWTEPRRVQSWIEAPPKVGWTPVLPNTQTYIQYSARLAIDASNGPYAGWLYSVVTSHVGGRLQVQISRSSDSGETWSAPAPVSAVAGTFEQFEPSVTVSDTGVLAVSWMDRRNDPANVKYQPMVAYSTDGGMNFSEPLLLDRQFSNPKKIPGFIDNILASGWAGKEWVGGFIATGDGADRDLPVLRWSRARP